MPTFMWINRLIPGQNIRWSRVYRGLVAGFKLGLNRVVAGVAGFLLKKEEKNRKKGNRGMGKIEKEFAEKPATQREPATNLLQGWLGDLKTRHIALMVTNGQPVLSPGASDHDWLMVERYRWALSRALLWPDWFAFITGRRKTPPPMEYFPSVLDRTSKDGKAFGCARCGWP
ncbi:hypothetical protein, partial [Stomatohabitans albus]|uniref:hypothetical protein n=1 Tax=Stomatohabitans albus TaxID=3110766 RepID=UPI00300D005B